MLPKLYHRLILFRIHGGTLRRMDKSIHRNIKSWLRLPHDVPSSYLYTDVKEGGLGIPSLRTSIPCLKFRRMEKLTKSTDDFISAMVKHSVTFKSEMARCHDPPIKTHVIFRSVFYRCVRTNNHVEGEHRIVKRDAAASLSYIFCSSCWQTRQRSPMNV